MRTFRRLTLAVISGSKPNRFSSTLTFFKTSKRNALKQVSMSVRFRFVAMLESVVSSLALAVKLKQFAAGLPSEIREVNTTVSGKVGVEWEVALKRVYGQAKAALPVVEVEAVAEPAALPPAEVTK